MASVPAGPSSRQVSPDPVRPLSVRGTVAPGNQRDPVHLALHRHRHPPVLARRADSDLDRLAHHNRRADVGRCVRPALRARGRMGRPSHHADPGDLRYRVRISPLDPGRARPPLAEAAGGPYALRAVCRIDPGVPLVALLFMASAMFPLFLPGGADIDALLRAQIAIIRFAAAYPAEVVRCGLQAIRKARPKRQRHSASPWCRARTDYSAAGAPSAPPWLTLSSGDRGYLAGIDRRHVRSADDGQEVAPSNIFRRGSVSTEIYIALALIYVAFLASPCRKTAAVWSAPTAAATLTGDRLTGMACIVTTPDAVEWSDGDSQHPRTTRPRALFLSFLIIGCTSIGGGLTGMDPP